METPRSEIIAEALELSRRLAAVAEIDDKLAGPVLDRMGDAQLAAVWLALPLDELEGRSPVEAWVAGDQVSVEWSIQRIRGEPKDV